MSAETPIRRDSMNLIRLALASAVLVSHAFVAFGLPEPMFGERTLGTWAVACFFAISGFFIMGSGLRLGLLDFLRHRIARIYPGYWVCLLGTAVLAVIAGLWGRDNVIASAARYVVVNLSLVQVEGGVAGTLSDVPYRGAWNVSLWTLAHEMLCYLSVALICLIVPRRALKALLPLIFLGCLGAYVLVPHVVPGSFFAKQFFTLAPFFFAGAALRVWGLPKATQQTAVFAFAALVGVLGLTVVHPHVGPQLGGPLLAWGLLALARVLPSPGFVQRHDLSYGVYLYAFPVSQALVLTGIFGSFVPYVLGIAVLTAAVAWLSWRYCERPSLQWARSVGPTAGSKL